MFIAGVLFVPAWLSLRNLQTDPANLIVIDATGASLGQRLRSNLTSASMPPNASTTIDVRVTAPDGIAAAGASVNSEQEVSKRSRRFSCSSLRARCSFSQ